MPDSALPAIALTTAGTDRTLNLNALGKPAVLILHSQGTADAALAINTTLRAAYPSADDLMVASVIDLRQFPGMFRGMVESELEKAYHKAAGRLPEGAVAEDLVVLLPDWDGAAHDALGLQDTGSRAAVVVADAAGTILGTDQGDDPGAAALTLLARDD